MLVRTIRGLLATTLLVALTASASHAQMESSSRFGINAGIAAPMGDFGDATERGFIVGAQFTMPLGEKLKLRLNADLSRYGIADGVDGNWMLIGGMANLVIPIPSSSEPKAYVLGGVGVTDCAKLDITGSPNSSTSAVAFNGGLGFNFNTGSPAWFTEVKFVSIRMEGSWMSYVPVVLGLKF